MSDGPLRRLLRAAPGSRSVVASGVPASDVRTVLPMTEARAALQWTEEQEIAHWKHRCFKELGFSEAEAQWLVLVGVDWHDAQRLILKGCSHEMVKGILSPVRPPSS